MIFAEDWLHAESHYGGTRGVKMAEPDELEAYMAAIREEVCSQCRERLSGSLPCSSQSLVCGIEVHLSRLVEICHSTNSCLIGPYLDRMQVEICATCENQGAESCPCPMQQLLPLVVQTIESVDRHRNVDYGSSGTE